MRIVGGIYRSRIIVFPEDEMVRPTKDRIRESIFNALSSDVIGRDVLDLFAGSGAYGLEAISRGSKSVTFVDNYRKSIEAIKFNVNSLDINSQSMVINTDYASFLTSNSKQFSLVFLDPPYRMDIYKDVIRKMEEKEIITSNAIIVCEADHQIDFKDLRFASIKEYRYGEIFVFILRR
ncbi:MAG: 16S rRNA (guanine(966)-N(2))-methyltransferase RsmD [Erysipelotrichaceae bacterium]|nr:16S rRNA (guanine(966)-N(2))-methyltransferase RsmD [Erysipelotrichaceae bacterium]